MCLFFTWLIEKQKSLQNSRFVSVQSKVLFLLLSCCFSVCLSAQLLQITSLLYPLMWKWPPVVSGGDTSVANLVSSGARAPAPAPLIQAASPAASALTTLLAHPAVINDYSRWEHSDSGWQMPCIQIIVLFSQIALQSANHLIGTVTIESFLCVGAPKLQPNTAWGMDSSPCIGGQMWKHALSK